MMIPLTIEQAGTELRAGEFTSQELTEAVLARIDHDNGVLGAIVGRCDEAALAAAGAADRELDRGEDRGPLHGIPVALKDVLATADAPTTAQSLAMLPGYQGFDSAAAANLRQAGAVLVAKAACSEFACGTPDAAKPFPFPRNPWDLDRWAGGSSGGSASGLLARFFLGAVGTDTGGSIRVPAAFSGISGLKPTFGLVSRYGCVPLSYSMDHVGPMARTARDCALLLTALAGPDPRDEATADSPEPEDYSAALTGDLTGMRIGVAHDDHAQAALPEEMISIFEKAVSELEAAGAQLVDVTVPFSEELFTSTRIIINSEALEIHRNNLRDHWADYGRPTRMSMATGAFYGGADYARALRVLAKGKQLVSELFETIDCVVSLTCPMAAWRFEEIAPRATLKAPLFTSRWNGLGMPAVSIPIGMLAVSGVATGLPVAMQLSGPRYADAVVLRAADGYQARTDWHLQVPPLFADSTPLARR
jgi:aspartyl-tRNA(Asn)/glutamyl-tRNA(Gln) amidotransferase subunit A